MESNPKMVFMELMFIKVIYNIETVKTQLSINFNSLIIVVTLIFLMTSCKQHASVTLNSALDSAGKNRNELEKVLAYYSNPKDSLKLKAAQFLIENMPGHRSNYGERSKRYARVFSIIDTMSYYRESLTIADKTKVADSITRINEASVIKDDNIISDSKIITAQYLINNIELAFKVWQKVPWKKQISFHDFCEYILPYRIRGEQVQYWRSAFYAKYNKLIKTSQHKDLKGIFDDMKYATESETALAAEFNAHYPLNLNLSDIIKGHLGACETMCFYAVTSMRAAGLPVALDYVPHWGNYNSRGHHISHLIDHPKVPALLTNDNNNIYLSVWGIVDFASDFNNNRHLFTKNDMPRGLYIQNIKTIPKVYRYSYAVNPQLQEINKSVPANFVPPVFKETYMNDVTDEYLKSVSVHLDVPPGFTKNQVAYLCVFDVSGSEPVAISRITNQIATFNKIGPNVMYLPAVYDNGAFKPIGSPFWVDSLNTVRQIVKMPYKKQNVTLIRKFALYSYTAYHTEVLKGGRFEASNSPDFSNPELLYQINNYPFYMNEVNVKASKPYRYLRYVAPAGGLIEDDNIAEVQFFAGKDTSSLKGSFMGMTGRKDHGIEKAFDNKIDSYYQNLMGIDGWIGIDLGKENKKTVSTIKFCPRNDTNCIMPNNEYELFYWDGKWVSLGSKIAKGYQLAYNNIPVNCLYWLKCKTGGQDERVFTIENGNQIWW